MDNNKRKPIPENELSKMKQNARGYYIDDIPHYPKNNTHLQAYTQINLGFDILYNADSYVLKYDESGNGILQSENKWAVLATNSEMFKYNNEFDSVEDAVAYAYMVYEEHITEVYINKINILNEIKMVME